jgi:hypothetical protein
MLCVFSFCNVVMFCVCATRAPSDLSTGSDVQVRHLLGLRSFVFFCRLVLLLLVAGVFLGVL